jgi:ribosomal protein S27AE
MARRGKIDLEKVRALLNTFCTNCGYEIPPNEIRRLNADEILCPKCGKAFVPIARKDRAADF